MAEEAKWYVVHTYSGYENKVAQNIAKVVENRRLHDLIPEVRVPMETVTEIKGDKTAEVDRKLFPSYVLVKMVMTDDTWYIVRNTTGVTGFVGPGSKPVPLTAKEVAKLGVESGRQPTEVSIDIKEGDSVVIVGGSFDGFTGTAKSIDLEAKTVEVIVSMMGREMPVTLPANEVKKEG